ncbi:hypothetical protein C8J57DRAFT_1526889 [Mycena rebaudengoi]|nr:hypothetical protein C8J57DRAFT_1526889 [Mycena rebaudengoi]
MADSDSDSSRLLLDIPPEYHHTFYSALRPIPSSGDGISILKSRHSGRSYLKDFFAMLTATFLLLLVPCLSAASSNIQELFLSAPSFAVVGASNNEAKFGTIVFKTLLAHGADVVPINPASRFHAHREPALTSHISSPQHLKESPASPCSRTCPTHPTRPSPSSPPPSVTLEILKQVAALGIFAIWLQPGAEDAAIRAFIANSTALSGRSIFSTDTLGPCSVGNPEKPDLISTLGS